MCYLFIYLFVCLNISNLQCSCGGGESNLTPYQKERRNKSLTNSRNQIIILQKCVHPKAQHDYMCSPRDVTRVVIFKSFPEITRRDSNTPGPHLGNQTGRVVESCRMIQIIRFVYMQEYP